MRIGKMINDRLTCLDLDDYTGLDSSDSNCSVGTEDTITSDQDDIIEAQESRIIKSSGCLHSGVGSKFARAISSLFFLSLLEQASGSGLAFGWFKLKSGLCSLLYVKECFDKARLKGENVPNFNITGIISSILSKAGVSSKNGMASLVSLNPEADTREKYYISDYFGLVSRNFTFNKTETMLRLITEKSMEDYEYMYDTGVIDQPYPHEVDSYPFSDYAIRSNVSRGILNKIRFRTHSPSRNRGVYCPSVSEYLSTAVPIDTSSIVPTQTAATISNIISESSLEPTTLVLVSGFVMLLFSFVLYALFSLGRRKNSAFVMRNRRHSAFRRSVRRDNVERCHLLSEISEEKFYKQS